MIKKILNNWPIKIGSIFLAILFWLYVSSTSAKVDNFPGGISLDFHNIPENTVAISDTQNIEVEIAAEKNIWTKLSSSSLTASANLSGLTEGTYELPVEIQSIISDVEIVDYNPSTILVRIEPRIKKTVPVNVKIEGEAGDGLVSAIPIIEIEEVTASGPKSEIENLSEATALVRLDGESDEVKKITKLIALDSDNEKINTISFEPAEIEVTVPIVKAETTKTVGLKVVTDGQPASGYWISSINTNPSTLTITGDSSVIKNITNISTKSIEIDAIEKSINTNATLDVPEGVSLVDQVSSVKVEINLSQTTTSKTVQPQIITLNISPVLEVFSIDPQSIEVNVSGPVSKLSELENDDISLNIDLKNYLTASTYTIDVNKDMFNAPEGITVTSFAPSSIGIVLNQK